MHFKQPHFRFFKDRIIMQQKQIKLKQFPSNFIINCDLGVGFFNGSQAWLTFENVPPFKNTWVHKKHAGIYNNSFLHRNDLCTINTTLCFVLHNKAGTKDSSQRFFCKIFTPSFALPLIKLFNASKGGGSGESCREIYNSLN